ncbi:ParB/RepB/Spo0J family partition protein [uncultured Roseovarius sp.]|jgi:ParB family chromosome partitioning protein|uniref:ParB/RepB/Spo0J family partition protein n=1 Tax=uncultured Roseovarius sp. TaxID=293344 RepID=UPI000C3B1715|nr:chromosome partitioning protein ParB [Roseovarius sp.]MBD11211.1 chromosome partitioning protein ParB [Roseovarius sp.]|tara:strand:- start:55 stop:960 length:906 start_codon:yes stop_codon:yes gene_type:complete
MTGKKSQPRGLGRGLSALMADVTTEGPERPADTPRRPDLLVPVEKVRPNPNQPRRDFDSALLEDLARSIAEKGVLQPLIVRPIADREGEYEIVAGERRWRAAQMAKLHQIPVLVRDFNDTEVLEVAIIENIQRADLNPVEEAFGYQQLMQKFGHTQERLAEALGKSRSHIANSVRLLSLPDEVLGYVREGKLSSGHARALITLDDPAAAARQVIQKSLSVRDTEKMVKTGIGNIFMETGRSAKPRKEVLKDADTRALEDDLSASLTMKVEIEHVPGQENGRITIHYASLDQLDRLIGMLSI